MINLAKIKPGEKICIVVFGNIASGKSTFCNNIKNLLPQFSIVCIDNNRRNLFGEIENNIQRERKAEEQMIEQLFCADYVIYETTGASRLFKSIQQKIMLNFKTIFVFIKCSVSECRFRYNHRTNDLIVRPAFGNKLSIGETMYSIQKKMITKFDIELDSEKLNSALMVEHFKTKYFNFYEKQL